jgi:AAA15 family ATPase/GTPase
MDNLILNSLEIKNFRAFRHLQVPQLGRVNLFVGKNNVGKSSLLEALWLYARRGDPGIIWQVLEARQEFRHSVNLSTGVSDVEERFAALRYLFYGRREAHQNLEAIEVGEVNNLDSTLSIAFRWFTEQLDEYGQRHLLPFEKSSTVSDQQTLPRIVLQGTVPGLFIQIGDQSKFVFRLNDRVNFRHAVKVVANQLVLASGMSAADTENLWERIALTDLEQDVIAALHILASDIEGVSFISNVDRTTDGTILVQRVPIVKIAGLDEPIPLRSLGEGMNRMFGVALALANVKNGMLLIDEIESGLHYSVQSDMWRLVFEMAHRLNVQAFATTHSWDCITAFQQAAREDVHEEGLLIRLERRNDDVRATLFDEEDLTIVTREQIEVR